MANAERRVSDAVSNFTEVEGLQIRHRECVEKKDQWATDLERVAANEDRAWWKAKGWGGTAGIGQPVPQREVVS